MLLKIQKWGNSLALRIPKSFAVELNLKQDSEINLSIKEGKLVIEPIKNTYQLSDLMDKVNENNIHSEYTTDKPKGKELW